MASKRQTIGKNLRGQKNKDRGGQPLLIFIMNDIAPKNNDLSLETHPKVLGMYKDNNKYVVFIEDITTSEPVKTFRNKGDGISFMKNHDLPIGNFDKWVWDLTE